MRIYIGDVYNITWDAENITSADYIRIDLSRNNGLTTEYITSALNSGTYSWTVTAPATNKAIIYVSDLYQPEISGGSNKFEIRTEIATGTSFNVWVSQYSTFSELDKNIIVDDLSDVEFSDLSYNTKYFWKVKAIDKVYGNESEWSNTCWFVTRYDDVRVYQSSANNEIVWVCGANYVIPNCVTPNGQIGGLRDTVSCFPSTLGTGVACNPLLKREE